MAGSQGWAGVGLVRDGLLEQSRAPTPGCRVRPGRRLVTAGRGPGVGISPEEFRAVEKFGPKKKKYLQNICYGCCIRELGLL